MSSPAAIALILVIAFYVAPKLYRCLRVVYLTPLNDLPGPSVPSWVYGNLKEIGAVENTLLPDSWFERYGKTFVDREFFMLPRLWTLDPRALQHILNHPNEYPRPEGDQRLLSYILGPGLLSDWGEEHRKQRRILNPAFGPAQIRDLTQIFVEKSLQLREMWTGAVQGGTARINVNKDLSKATLDIIGVAGFGYDFHSLSPEDKPNELRLAFRKLLLGTPSISAIAPFLLGRFPALGLLFKGTKHAATLSNVSEVFHRVGKQLVDERKADVLRETSEKHVHDVERKDLQGRDLLTLLIRANLAKDVPDAQRLSDEDVNNQIPTFLLAGHETTSVSSTWALFALSRHPIVQQKLRQELLSVQTDTPTMEELSALPFLDAVVRETLRLHPPIATITREAAKDDVIPLSEPIIDRHGKAHEEIRVVKGNKVVIPILAMHRSKEIWGEDALEFKPERWERPPEAVATIPGVWGNLLTFFGGPRACIGYRFSIVELKAILFTLVRAFEFELAVPVEDIAIQTSPAQRPSVKSEPEQGFQLPLLVKPYKGA